jgi:hypothetical protein
VRLLRTLEVLASLLCEAYFERLGFCMLDLARLTLVSMRRSTERIPTALTF